MVRTRSAAPLAVVPSLRREALALAPDQPLYNIKPLSQAIQELGSSYRLGARVFEISSWSATCLALIGIYGAASFAVSLRLRDLALRLALGAKPLPESPGP